MRKIFPTSDSSKLALLTTIAQAAQQTERPLAIFDGALSQVIAQTANDYQQEYLALSKVRSQIKGVRDQRRQQLVYLKHLLRRAFAVVRARAKEPGFPRAHVVFFGLLQDARQPKLIRDLSDPVQIAKDLLFANRELNTAGARVLIDPSPEQIEGVVAEIEAQQRALGDLQEVERVALAAIRSRRQRVCQLLRRISFEIEMATQGWTSVARRNLMRSLGFRFKSQSGEVKAETQVEDEEAVQATALPAEDEAVQTAAVPAEEEAVRAAEQSVEEEAVQRAELPVEEEAVRATEQSVEEAAAVPVEADAFAAASAALAHVRVVSDKDEGRSEGETARHEPSGAIAGCG